MKISGEEEIAFFFFLLLLLLESFLVSAKRCFWTWWMISLRLSLPVITTGPLTSVFLICSCGIFAHALEYSKVLHWFCHLVYETTNLDSYPPFLYLFDMILKISYYPFFGFCVLDNIIIRRVFFSFFFLVAFNISIFFK